MPGIPRIDAWAESLERRWLVCDVDAALLGSNGSKSRRREPLPTDLAGLVGPASRRAAFKNRASGSPSLETHSLSAQLPVRNLHHHQQLPLDLLHQVAILRS
jgi:hypothetical protein